MKIFNNMIKKSFVNILYKKYTNNISVNQYILERINYSNIDKIFITDNTNSQCSFIAPFKNTLININKSNIDIIYNYYGINSFYSALTYSEAFNKPGIVINSTNSNFEGFEDLLCISKPIFSICIYNNLYDLQKLNKKMKAINPCFIQTHTIRNLHQFPEIFETLLNDCNMFSAPVHLNILNSLSNKEIDLSIYNHKS